MTWHIPLVFNTDLYLLSITGADPGFFLRRGCTRLLFYFNTNKPHSFFIFFCRIPVVLENRRSFKGAGGGGGTPPAPPP